MVIDTAFLSTLPNEGFLEFDYVSTTRPPPPPPPAPETADDNLDNFSIATPPLVDSPAPGGHAQGWNDVDEPLLNEAALHTKNELHAMNDLQQPSWGALSGEGEEGVNPNHDHDLVFGPSFVNISDEQFASLLEALGMASHRKLTLPAEVLYTLLELHLAVAKYYFTVHQVLAIVYSFDQEDHSSQAKVNISSFSFPLLSSIQSILFLPRYSTCSTYEMISYTMQ